MSAAPTLGVGCDDRCRPLPTALTVAAIRLETTFLLVDSDLHYDEESDYTHVAYNASDTIGHSSSLHGDGCRLPHPALSSANALNR